MPRVTSNVHANPDHELVAELFLLFRNTWSKHFEQSDFDAMRFSKLSVVALTQLSAILAVDVGMTPEQFVAVCNAQFAEAHKHAPRFS